MEINSVGNSIYFRGGLKKNLRQGERALCEFKEEFPYVKSSTYWHKRLNNINRKRRVEHYTGCDFIIMGYDDKIEELRSTLNSMRLMGQDCLENLRRIMREEKFGNCEEAADIISANLNRAGIEHKKMRLDIQRRAGWGNDDHAFIVIGMDKKAIPSQPSTWGNKAVIIDGWMNFVLSAKDGLSEYERFFDAKYIDPRKDTTKGLTPRFYFSEIGQ